MSNNPSSTVVFVPVWCEETISSVNLLPIGPDRARAFLSRLRDARLQEVDELEKLLEFSETTAEIRRQHKELKATIRYLKRELDNERNNERNGN